VVMTAISVFGRASTGYTPAMQSILVVLGMLVIATAGWMSVSRLGYRLRWAPVIGLALSVGSHWSLFVVHDFAEIPPLVLVNSAIFAIVALLGGCAAVVYHRTK
jgi:ABC-type multidrug transport system permease subunit